MRRTACTAAMLLALLAAPHVQAQGAGDELRDFDQDEEERSDFWERALEPGKDKYEDLVARAATLLKETDAESRQLAGAILRDAIRLAPRLPAGHMWLGRYEAQRGDFAACAASIGRALAADPHYQPAEAEQPAAWAAAFELAECRARAGDLEGALDGLRRILEEGHEGGQTQIVHVRLGQCYMALGRLEEAKAALALARNLAPHDLDLAFSLGVAHDRDEETAQARELIGGALERDPSMSSLQRSARVWIPAEDLHYHLGLGALYKGDHPRALYQFRRYLALAGESPWVRRARAHLEEAQSRATAGRGLLLKGSATLDAPRTQSAIARLDGPLQACLQKTPDLLLRVVITRVVPSADADPGRAAAPGVRVLIEEQSGASGDDLRAAIRCTETIAAKAALPRPSGGPGTYATAEFLLVHRGQAPNQQSN